ncbi:precorrin-3B C(17)-methyltransferase [Comamonas serinivorans]|uniref:Precorrin-3B C(17)-methyltransferase n=1 Tax=Comamonas serinivorans TaxID=1082851 RepID=A0A1Y0EQC9_9BURK|nr:precorrin-3B C(17)-methyltransferase [Comamonas serinivorans]ARU05611.1 precorrin-3B C(17)-methyltransferase [Comamonas serinivorans]
MTERPTASAAGRLSVIGIGPGADDLITPQVQAAIDDATDALGYYPYVDKLATRGHLQLHGSDNREELARARSALDLAAQGRRVLVVSSGDPGVFAMASAVFEALDHAPAADQARWAGVEVQVLPGITAMLAAAARLGAPLGHDFCVINLSDNLKPAATITHRIRLAAQADLAMAFYNPSSKSRPEGFARALAVLREECEPGRLICFARNVSRADERLAVHRLDAVQPDMADMRTLVIVGNSLTRQVGRHVYTPRSHG